MDHREIDDHHVPERYLLGQLSAEDTERFEDHLLDCRECLERLEIGERFQGALRDVVAEDAARTAVRAGVLAGLRRLGKWRGLGLAVLALALLLPSAVLTRRLDHQRAENRRLQGDLERALSPRLGPPLLRLGPVRGGPGESAPANRITVTSEQEWIVLVLEVDSAPGGVCRLRLETPGGAAGLSGDEVERDPVGDVVLVLPSANLEAGDHVVVVTCPSPEGRGSLRTPFAFRVVRAR